MAGAIAISVLAGHAFAQSPPPASRARLNYVQFCSGCHLPDGSGAPNKGIPSMRDILGQFLAVSGGREYLVQVPGVMNSPLADRDIAELMNWLLPKVSKDTLPADFQPYQPDEIGRLRASRPTDFAAVRKALLARMTDGAAPLDAAR